MKTVRVNVRAKADISKITRIERDGRQLIVVPSATLPDNVVMNGVLYPPEEIEKSFRSLEGTFAPLGHPVVNGQYISSLSAQAVNKNYIGAWNENVRRENGRVFLDKVIDVEFAKKTEGGVALLNAIEKGEPIHTSTGLFCKLDKVENNPKFSARAKDIIFDHDAIMLNSTGAATPEQGVGMLVNGEVVEVINSAVDVADQELDWAGIRLVEALERRNRATFWEQLKSVIMGAMPTEREILTNEKEPPMTDSKEQFDELSLKVNALSEAIAKIDIAKTVSDAIKPLTDNLETMRVNALAAEKAEKDALIEKVAATNVLSKEACEGMTVNALKEFYEKFAKPGSAAGLNSSFKANSSDKDEFKDTDLNAIFEVK